MFLVLEQLGILIRERLNISEYCSRIYCMVVMKKKELKKDLLKAEEFFFFKLTKLVKK